MLYYVTNIFSMVCLLFLVAIVIFLKSNMHVLHYIHTYLHLSYIDYATYIFYTASPPYYGHYSDIIAFLYLLSLATQSFVQLFFVVKVKNTPKISITGLLWGESTDNQWFPSKGLNILIHVQIYLSWSWIKIIRPEMWQHTHISNLIENLCLNR